MVKLPAPVNTKKQLQAALDAASKGYFVLPMELSSGRKRPLVKWQEESTRDESTIRGWFTKWPTAGYGIDTGKSELVVVDLDIKGGKNGVVAWEELTEVLNLPDAFTVHTTTGGQHRYFRGSQIRNSAGTVAEGVDIRGQGGLVVGPGSVLGGKTYRVDAGSPLPRISELPKAPEALLALLTPKKRSKESQEREHTTGMLAPTRTHTEPVGSAAVYAALDRELALVREAPEGKRNDTLNRAAMNLGQLVGADLSETLVREVLASAAKAAGLDPQEIHRTISSGLTRGIDDPRAKLTVDEHHRRQVQEQLQRLKVMDEAKLLFKQEQQLRDFEQPPSMRTLAEELELPEEDEPWLVEGLLQAGGNLVIAAGYKTGKTTLVQNLVRSLVNGERFLGEFKTTPLVGKVALFNFELTEAQQVRWLRESGITDTNAVMLSHLRGRRGILTTDAGKQWVAEQLKANEVQVWVIDPFARAASGLDENSNTDVGLFLEHLDEIKRLAKVSELVLVTHTGRGNPDEPARARGATRLNDWADTNMTMVKDSRGNRSIAAEGRDVWVGKTRLAYDVTMRRLSVLGDGEAPEHLELVEQIFQFVRSCEPNGASARDIHGSAELSASKDRKNAAIKALTDSGRLTLNGPMKGGRPTFTTSGQTVLAY
ncbi:bifunctional DNA primase/polymerase [Arthrobacter citreus]|uniref:Bifunctional DNA primase/polymerase n=1 Tax=Arthrobacter citreus TaxID=1670 RepID=A0ABZ2ZWK2_9MICC